MARRPDLLNFAREHQIPIITIAQLIEYRRTHTRAPQFASPEAKDISRPLRRAA